MICGREVQYLFPPLIKMKQKESAIKFHEWFENYPNRGKYGYTNEELYELYLNKAII